MLIDFQKPLLDLKGEPLTKEPADLVRRLRIAFAAKNDVVIEKLLAETAPFLLVDACQESLTATFPDDPQLPGVDKIMRFTLALKIGHKLPVEITIEEAAEIKKLVAKTYGPLVVGRVWEIFEAKTEAKSEERQNIKQAKKSV